MLAIMNVGKYSSSPLPPAGEVIIEKLSSQSVATDVDLFAYDEQKEKIVGIKYNSPIFVVSLDSGVTWQDMTAEYSLGGCCYNPSDEKFYFIDNQHSYNAFVRSDEFHIGYLDGSSIVWDTLPINNLSDTYAVVPHWVKVINGIVCFGVAYQYGTGTTSSPAHSVYRIYDKNKQLLSETDYSGRLFYSTSLPYANLKKTSEIILGDSNSPSSGVPFNQNGFGSPSLPYPSMSNDVGVSQMQEITPSGQSQAVYQQIIANGLQATVLQVPKASVSNHKTAMKGYFEIGQYVYIYTANKISRAMSIVDAYAISDDNYTSLSDITNISAVLALSGKECFISANSKIYKCRIK